MKPSDPFSELKDGDTTIIRPSPGGRRTQTSTRHARRTAATVMVGDSIQALDTAGDNPLIVSAFSLLSLISKLRNLPFHDAVNELQQRLITEIRTFEDRALTKGASQGQMDIAKYLLCALLDETVLNTPWGSQSGWGHNSLSSQFYKKLVGGEEFFQILDRLKQQPSQNQDLLELAYLCLSLGFEGKYRYTNNGLHTLERQRQDLYLLIQQIKGDPQPELSTHWRGVGEEPNPLIRHVPLWVLAGVAGVLLMLIYMGFSFAIRNRSDQLYDELFAMARHMEKTPVTQLVRPLEVVRPTSLIGARLKGVLADEIAQRKVSVVEDRGLRIFNMFPSGSAEVRRDYQAVLGKIARALQPENISVLIVGHTDNQRLKFSTRFKSNWHLSQARAESAARSLAANGLPAERMRVEAMADKDPIVPNDTTANRALNRRIDIFFR
jgi:type VI secretion system protein ImpK